MGTWNIHLGIHNDLKKDDIIEALKKVNADIIGIQETGAREDVSQIYKDYFFFSPKSTRNEGLGFIMKRRFQYFIEAVDSSLPRILSVTFSIINVPNKKSITCINYHAPTNVQTQTNEDVTYQFYEDLQKAINQNNGNLIVLMGDTNARLGLQKESATYQGKHSIGSRNLNGQFFAHFLQQNNLIAINTCFQLVTSQIITWVGPHLRIDKYSPQQKKQVLAHIDHISVPYSMWHTKKTQILGCRSFNASSSNNSYS